MSRPGGTVWFRRHPDRDREMRAHLELEEAELRAAGLSDDEARRTARLKFGDITIAQERLADGRSLQLAETLWQDLRYGVRLLRRHPGFTVTAALVLSLGIGVNTALFSIVNSLFFKPLPVERPEELFYLGSRNSNGEVWAAIDPRASEFIEREAADLATFTRHWIWTGARFSDGEQTERLTAALVTSDYFPLLGVTMAQGRAFRVEEDDRSNTELSMVVSDALWKGMLQSDPDVIGRRVRLNEKWYRVIGVAPPEFAGLSDPWHPIRCWVTPAQATGGPIGMGPIGRLKPGATIDQFRALLAARMPVYREEQWRQFPAEARRRFPNYRQEGFYGAYLAADVSFPMQPEAQLIPTPVLTAMVTVVALVLVIATANIAGLLLARGVSRTGEIAVRRALGAGVWRLARQLLTETLVLATLAGLAGGGIALGLVRLFAAVTPTARSVEVLFDGWVWAFAVIVSIGTGLAVGIAPAVQAGRLDVLQAMGAGVVGARRSGGRASRWMLVPQVALSLVLLLLAGVHVRALARIELDDLGYNRDNAVALQVGRWVPVEPWQNTRRRPPEEHARIREEQAASVRRFHRAVLDRVEQVPGVQSYGLAAMLPLAAVTGEQGVMVPRADHERGGTLRGPGTRIAVSHGYFEAMGMRLLQGRPFDDRDRLYGTRVAVISEGMARRLWPRGDAIGSSVGVVPWGGQGTIEWLEVIGIVNEVDPVIAGVGERPMVYVSLLQEWMGSAYWLVVRTDGDPLERARELRAAVVGADPYAEVANVQTLDQIAAELLYPRRAAAGILAAAGLIGLTLAAIGLYGVVSHAAAQRVRELGIRATLGAAPRQLVTLLLREGAIVMAIGTAAGLVLAFSALRLTRASYPDVPTLDLVTYVAVPSILAAVVLTSCLIPARRAARMDPAKVLRGE